MTFADLNVPPALIAALARQRITDPTAIQIAALPVLLEGKDASLRAETGTGKTLAYLLPLLCRLEVEQATTQLLIVAPSHELTIQIKRQCCDLAQNAGSPIRTVLLIGGTPMDRQVEKLKRKPHIVVGTPGRMLDLISMGKLKAHLVRSIVIDEADRLLVAENLPAIHAILRAAPRRRQMVFASATEKRESADAIAALAPDRVMIETGVAPVNENIEHLYLVCEERDKPEVLRKLLHALRPERAMVFVHRNDTAEEVAAKLAFDKIAVADLHASFGKLNRKQAMDDFRSARVRVLIASDLAARGLDIQGITHVINVDVPTLSLAYLHRAGRTARAGAKGQAITLMTDSECRLVRRYERELSIALQQVRMREGQVRAVDETHGDPVSFDRR